jgi:hypothetical protein
MNREQFPIDARFVAHLGDDDNPNFTACGEPWQDWQAPKDADLLGVPVLPGQDKPKAHVDRIRQCQACFRVAMRS